MGRIRFFSLACLAFAGALCMSCSLDPEAVAIWGGNVSVPALLSLETVSETELIARFSAPVTVNDALVSIPRDGSTLAARWTPDTDGKTVSFAVSGTPGIGVRALLSGSVSDAKGDSLSFSVPYTGYNSRPAKLKINEVRTTYTKPKVEYIEFYVVEAGNLGGVEICNVRNEDDPSREFPAVEVKAGDYIVYHLRSIEEGLVDETDSITASSGTDARPGARDFWNNLTKSPLKADNVIFVRERKGGSIMDALLLASADLTDWPTDALKAAAAEAVAAGAWKPGAGVVDAVCSTGMTATKTLGRNEQSFDTDMASDWKLCDKSKCSPGAANPPL